MRMSYQYNADEILQMAEQIERNGARFYRKASEVVRDETVAKSLLHLAAWEDGHEKVFASMRRDLTEFERQPTVFDPEGETSLYLRALADGHVFDVRVDAAESLTGAETLEDILRLAIGQEKDSIIFYLGLREIIPEKAGRDKIDAVIQEEMRHIGFLNKEIAASRQRAS